MPTQRRMKCCDNAHDVGGKVETIITHPSSVTRLLRHAFFSLLLLFFFFKKKPFSTLGLPKKKIYNVHMTAPYAYERMYAKCNISFCTFMYLLLYNIMHYT